MLIIFLTSQLKNLEKFSQKPAISKLFSEMSFFQYPDIYYPLHSEPTAISRKNKRCPIFDAKWPITKILSNISCFDPIQVRLFQGCSGMGDGGGRSKKAPSLKSVTHILQ